MAVEITRRMRILATTSDLASRLMHDDRKDDEDLPRGAIQEAIEAGEITVEDIVNCFTFELRKILLGAGR